MSSESWIRNRISSKRSKIESLNADIANINIKIEDLEAGLAAIEAVYAMHCELFDSSAVSELSSGYDIELVSAQEMGEESDSVLNGFSEGVCRAQLAWEIQETKLKIAFYNQLKYSYQSSIYSLQDDISDLRQELSDIINQQVS